ncbi:MAG: ATP-binding cassette domain-containing protein [Candidatus Glassbacteria bacterium]|nr:ATP-binding cassette domain-containing protein [Candidatus Glassbacteria bacterium]
MISVNELDLDAGGFSLRGVSFEIPTGGYGVLMGRTGSGKTTILEGICGLRPVRSGTVCLMGRDVTRLKPGERGIGYVPQDGALFTTMTVREHLALGPTIRRHQPDEVARRVAELAEMLGIEHLLERKPAGLSGGEIQRVALGRALSIRPRVLCLDEPLHALDDETHEEMCRLLVELRRQSRVTTLHVTHSRSEMERLADHLFVLEDGAVSLERTRLPAAGGASPDAIGHPVDKE